MHDAAERGLIDMMEKFIDRGGDMTLTNNRGFSCLHLACQEGHTDMVKLLLAKGKIVFLNYYLTLIFPGCDENMRDTFGYTASYWAKKKQHANIIALLPPPQKRTQHEIYEYMQQVWDVHGFKPGKGGKKKGKKGAATKKQKK